MSHLAPSHTRHDVLQLLQQAPRLPVRLGEHPSRKYASDLILDATNLSQTAVGIIAASLYVLLSKWGPVDSSFLVGPCVTLLVYGLILFGGSVLGHLGLQYQYRREGVFTHKFVLSLFLAFQLACIAVEVYSLVSAARVSTEYRAKSEELAARPTTWYADAKLNSVMYAATEKYYANLFNNLFFGASAYTGMLRSQTLCTAHVPAD